MKLRPAVSADIPRLVEIAEAAKVFLHSNGIDQWQNGYPNEQTFAGDIANGVSYVLCEGDTVEATMCVSFEPDPTYTEIFGGEWLNDEPYAVVHRGAIAPECRGKKLGGEIFSAAAELCRERGVRNIRVDTHRGNKSMRGVLKRMGFHECGRIYLPDPDGHDPERLAYQLVLE